MALQGHPSSVILDCRCVAASWEDPKLIRMKLVHGTSTLRTDGRTDGQTDRSEERY